MPKGYKKNGDYAGKVFQKGKHNSLNTEFKKGNKGFWLGKNLLEEAKEKMSKAKKGKKLSKEHKINMRESARRGENHHNWNNGSSFEPYSTEWTDILKESIRQRDNYTCQLCGICQDELKDWLKKLDCHHIDYDKNNLNPENLITLCRSCHAKTNHNRNYWINYFKSNA